MKKNNNKYFFRAIIFISTIILYFIIYFSFRGNYGFSPGKDLTKGDWLSFFGNYLGFASSTLLAIMVFRQDQKINKLVSYEYDPILIFQLEKFERIKDLKTINTCSRYVVILSENRKLLFNQYVYEPKQLKNTEIPFRLYLNVKSKGKLYLREFKITEIILDDNLCIYEKDIENKHLIINDIQPNGIRYFCLMLKNFPNLQGSDVHTIRIKYSVLISNDLIYTDEYVLLITSDESTIFDGIEHHT